MKVEAGGQSRFHGWHEVISSGPMWLALPSGPMEGDSHEILREHVGLQLNGEYTVRVTFTKDDVKTLARRLLTKDEMLILVRLTDEDKISMAKDALSTLSSGDKPNIKVLFGMVEAMLSRDDVISMMKLTNIEKIRLVQETFRDMPFGQVIAHLHAESEQKIA